MKQSNLRGDWHSLCVLQFIRLWSGVSSSNTGQLGYSDLEVVLPKHTQTEEKETRCQLLPRVFLALFWNLVLLKKYCLRIWERGINIRNIETVLLFADDSMPGKPRRISEYGGLQ